MHAYVINLDRRPDRWEQISAHLTELQLSFERIPAVDGRTWDGNDWKKKGRSREEYWRGAAGCYFSHIHALQTAIARNIFPCIILEDDTIFTELPEFQRGMTYLGGYESSSGIHGFHAMMYSSRTMAIIFLDYARAHKNTIDSIGNMFRKIYDDVKIYHKGFIAIQRPSYSDIEGGTVERTHDGKIRWLPEPAVAQETAEEY
jgi:hypothetical protein